MTTFDPIFPGMDPFIEGQRWREFHGAMIIGMQNALMPLLVPRYDVSAEQYVFLNRVPDLSVRRGQVDTEPVHQSALAVAEPTRLIEHRPINLPEDPLHIEIHDDAGRLITIIELLSPTNKQRRRDDYIAKREAIFDSGVQFIELDLLRGGQRMEASMLQSGYALTVWRAGKTPAYQGQHFDLNLRDPLPVIPVPLVAGDPDVPLDLPSIFASVYRAAGYRLRLDYAKSPAVPFTPDDAEWVKERLEAAGL